MNNDQFRRLVNASDSPKNSSNNATSPTGASRPAAPRALGSRMKASIPMTPRSISGVAHKDFARQLAERKQAEQEQGQTKASRGPKHAAGYVDRSKLRTSEEEDDRASRLKALEASFKKEEIDQETYDKLRSQIAGGDLSSTHLVKGLDFKLLERVRKGEDVYNPDNIKKSQSPEEEAESQPDAESKEDEEQEEDIDAAFDQLEHKDVTAIQKEKSIKKGQMAPPSLVPGRKRTRDQILADMKAARAAAAAAAKAKEESSRLGGGFRKITENNKAGTRVERDSKGREVLIIVDEDGHERRKVRKMAGDEEAREKERLAMMPDKDVKPLGMEVPEQYKDAQQVEEEDSGDDIFGEAGDDYDPLAGMSAGSDSDSDEDDEGRRNEKQVKDTANSQAKDDDSAAMPPPPKPSGPKNYFADSKTKLASEEELKAPSMSDPTILAAIKKAASINRAEASMAEDKVAKAREERRRRMLQNDDRDAEDMDMGFGTSRLEDEEDAEAEEQGIKLDRWGDEDDGGEGGNGERNQKRKRGPKKRKGDGNRAEDVLRVLESRKGNKE
ncbi:uncharacterized protein MKZ38_003373 [Zalerion maritima]|uniref:RED-like N-terminal domain-containing protein n=1 Tax=Zalerion maritima TaxID=339359 RepID=A0AAD5RP26_9PEZI|nr:uncharacterized protein MKZ38_003373 [Zalerion maritima]